MPTLIDSLVIELGLDPKAFTEGQEKAIQDLRRFEERARQQAQRVEQQAAQGVLNFLRQIDRPFSLVNQHFERMALATSQPKRQLDELGAQGKRTGDSVEEGALSGAAGLRILGLAGVAAVASISALDKVLKSAGESARTVFGANVGSAAAGMNVQRFTAISQALSQAGNVPQEQTQSWLAQFTQWQERLRRTGQGAERLSEFTMTGLQGIDFMSASGEEVLAAFARQFAGLAPQDAISRGASMGLTPEQVLTLQKLGPNFTGAVDTQMRRATTDADSAAAKELLEAQNNLAISWAKMSRVIGDEIDPALSHFLNVLAEVVDGVASNIKVIEELGKLLLLGPLGRLAYNWATGNQTPLVPDKPGAVWYKPWTWFGGGGSAETAPTGGGRGSGATLAPPIAGSTTAQRAEQSIDFFMGRLGLTREQATGLTARLIAESGLDPNKRNPTSGAYGTAQWLGPRQPAALATGGDYGKQLELIAREYETTEAPALARLKATSTAPDAARATEAFERAGDPAFTESAAGLAARMMRGASAFGNILAIGDSIAVGVKNAGGLGGNAVGGRNTGEVLEAIRRMDSATLKGKGILLSSGMSNAGSDLAQVGEQLDLLLKAGSTPELLGVGTGVRNAAQVNEALAKIAKAKGVVFGGPLLTTEGGRVHPRDYGANLTQELALIRGASAAPSNTTHNYDIDVGDVHINAPHATDAHGISLAVGEGLRNQIRRSMMVNQANSGQE